MFQVARLACQRVFSTVRAVIIILDDVLDCSTS